MSENLGIDVLDRDFFQTTSRKATSLKASLRGTKNRSVSYIFYITAKRTLDIVWGGVGCLLLLPLAVVIKIVYLLSGDLHSIFYTQTRIGKHGKKFKLYKFRTMVPDADKILQKILAKDKKLANEYKNNKKLSNDPRITKAGAFLRRMSIDEFPQFINILKGEMSLVGNRPYLPREKKDMGHYFDTIVSARPGLISLWAVKGRSELDFATRLKIERDYALNRELKMDIKIALGAVVAVVKGKGAL